MKVWTIPSISTQSQLIKFMLFIDKKSLYYLIKNVVCQIIKPKETQLRNVYN